MKDETEVIDQDESAAKRIAAVFVAWNESGKAWREYVEELRQAAELATATYQTAVACVPSGGQLPMFPSVAGVLAERKNPRAKRQVIMHAGELAGSFECPKCHETEPIPEGTNDAARKRGVPCPKCNEPAGGRDK